MRDREYLLSLLDYSSWANGEYYKQVMGLPDDEVTKQRPSLMKNLLISVNHILVIEKIWLGHMKGETHDYKMLQTVLFEDLDELWAAKQAMDRELRAYVEGLSGDELEEVIEYELIGGNTGSLARYWIITHLAMHGGFHRGFMADMYGQIPGMPPIIPKGQDIPVWERETREG